MAQFHSKTIAGRSQAAVTSFCSVRSALLCLARLMFEVTTIKKYMTDMYDAPFLAVRGWELALVVGGQTSTVDT